MTETKFQKNREINDLLAEIKRLGQTKFAEMFGREMLDQLREIATAEKRLFPIREKIRLQGKLKHDYPLCEKCEHWHGVSGVNAKPCEFDKLEKSITFEENELGGNPFAVEVCEKFVWKKSDK